MYRGFIQWVLVVVVIAQVPAVCPACGDTLSDLVPTIEHEICIDEWHYIGPFSVGPREGIIGITADPGGLRPDDLRYPSMLAQGGYVTWEQAELDSTGWTRVEFEDVLWDTLMDIYGYAGIFNGAYAYGEFRLPAPGRALIAADRVGSFYLNGRLHYGDPYAHGYVRIPVVLKRGLNRVLVKLTGFGDQRFKFDILPVDGPVITLRDYTVPDMIAGEAGNLWIGVPLLNTTDTRLQNITVSAGDGSSVARRTFEVPAPAPLCVKKVPLEIEVLPGAADNERYRGPDAHGTDNPTEQSLPVPIEVASGGHTYRDTFNLRIRSEGQSFKRTFISSIDSSCQYYAVMRPLDYNDRDRYALIFTLHGANVEADRQVDAYKPKRWAFVVAPTNRRRYGFDWQDWGRLDALEVLEIAESTLPIDGCRIHLTGHSMGGHGVWHVGLAHPDRFAAMAPGAGWVSFELYVPWFLQKSHIFGEPYQRAARDMGLSQDWPLRFVENAGNLPVFILQGGADDNVPPAHARMFARRLHELGYDYRYKEDPGKGHWYNIDSLDVACVDDPDLISFFADKVLNRWPKHIVFKTTNAAHSSRAYWIEILEQMQPYSESRMEAYVRGDSVEISTCNVRQFTVSLSRKLIPSGRAIVCVDGSSWLVGAEDTSRIVFSQRAGGFRMGPSRPPGPAKTRDLYGPIKQAYFSPFVLVYGTRGSTSLTDMLLHQARLEAFQWWHRANGFAEVLPDSEITPEIIRDYNLILFGGPKENSLTRRINRFLPIRMTDRGLTVGGRQIETPGLAAKFVYPNPLNRSRLVVVHEGCDREGLELSTFFRAAYAGAGLPDFVIFDSGVHQLGWGAVIASGYFDSRWRVAKDLTFSREPLR